MIFRGRERTTSHSNIVQNRTASTKVLARTPLGAVEGKLGVTVMRRSSAGALCAAALVLVATLGCGSPRASQAAASPPPAVASPLPNTGPTPAPSVAPTVDPTPSTDPNLPIFAQFDSTKFSNGATITNEWMPLEPGRRWVLEGVTIEGGERIPHKITFTVTDLTKVINDVNTAVVWIEDFSDGELVEVEIAFYAQDDAGTVWYLGEHPEEYEDGEFVAAPTWIAGFDDAKPGIKMFADPLTHTQTYYQGWGPAVGWSDFGRIDESGMSDCVAAACYPEVIRFAESSDGEAGIFQLKSYAKGAGEIRVGWRGEAESREELELTSTSILSKATLAKFDNRAIDLEKHAYVISPKLYGRTEPMQ